MISGRGQASAVGTDARSMPETLSGSGCPAVTVVKPAKSGDGFSAQSYRHEITFVGRLLVLWCLASVGLMWPCRVVEALVLGKQGPRFGTNDFEFRIKLGLGRRLGEGQQALIDAQAFLGKTQLRLGQTVPLLTDANLGQHRHRQRDAAHVIGLVLVFLCPLQRRSLRQLEDVP